MQYIHSAGSINDLRVPPSNYLEQLKGDRKGQHSIRIMARIQLGDELEHVHKVVL